MTSAQLSAKRWLRTRWKLKKIANYPRGVRWATNWVNHWRSRQLSNIFNRGLSGGGNG